MKDALEYAEKTYVNVNIFEEKIRQSLKNSLNYPLHVMNPPNVLKNKKIFILNSMFSQRE